MTGSQGETHTVTENEYAPPVPAGKASGPVPLDARRDRHLPGAGHRMTDRLHAASARPARSRGALEGGGLP